MSKFKKTFQLKQHTPLIHFQSEQEGASLRATELKPKFDKFLIEQLGGVKKVDKKWLVGKGKSEHAALDYKVKIRTGTIKDTYLIDSYMSRREKRTIGNMGYKPLAPSPYFADTKNIKDKNWDLMKKGIFFEELERGCGYEVEIEFFSFRIEVLKKIEENFDTFLLLTNFGTRQSKGFGSFSNSDLGVTTIEQLYQSSGKKVLALQIRDKSIEGIFSTIVNDYQILKSGKQFGRGKTIDSKLKQHYQRKRIDGESIVWEKQVIKNEMFTQNDNYDVNDCIDACESERYIRALLGLAGQHSYPQREIPIDDVKIEDMEEDKEKKIDRFKSPLTFKPIGGKIYLIVEKIPDLLYDRDFEFSTKGRSSLAIKTPPLKHQLNLFEFVKNNMRNWNPITKN